METGMMSLSLDGIFIGDFPTAMLCNVMLLFTVPGVS